MLCSTAKESAQNATRNVFVGFTIGKQKRKQSKTNRIKHNNTVIVKTKKEKGYSDNNFFFYQNDDEHCARKCVGVAVADGRDQGKLFFVNNMVQSLL